MKSALLVGLGKSNIALLKYLKKRRYKVFTYDDKNNADYDYLRITKDKGIFDISFISPGIYPSSKVFSLIQKCSLVITSELFFALNLIKNKIHIIGVTGSNGKTTTVLIIKTILEELGAKVILGGNIGIPLISSIKSIERYDYLILEISSFQALYFNKKVINDLIITSYSPNHLDAYMCEEEYLLSKKRLIKCADNTYVDNKTKKKMNLDDKVICVDTSFALGEEKDHLLAKSLISHLGFKGIEKVDYIKCLPVSRYEVFYKKGNVIFIDDSKATSLGAVIEAINKSDIDTVLILGGHLKSNIDHKIQAKRIMIYGREKDLFIKYIENYELYSSLDKVIDALDIDFSKPLRVLFSPGGSSIDYANFEVRGKEFKRLIIEKFGS